MCYDLIFDSVSTEYLLSARHHGRHWGCWEKEAVSDLRVLGCLHGVWCVLI